MEARGAVSGLAARGGDEPLAGALSQTPLDPVDVGPEELVEPETARQFWEQEYNAALAARALDLARNEFEETTWKAFWMTTVEERDADTVGRELGLSRGAVYTAKSRVLNRLRKELGGLWE